MGKFDLLSEPEAQRLAAALTALGWQAIRPYFVARTVRRLTGRKFGYVDAWALEFLIQSAGSMLEAGRRSESQINDAIKGV